MSCPCGTFLTVRAHWLEGHPSICVGCGLFPELCTCRRVAEWLAEVPDDPDQLQLEL